MEIFNKLNILCIQHARTILHVRVYGYSLRRPQTAPAGRVWATAGAPAWLRPHAVCWRIGTSSCLRPFTDYLAQPRQCYTLLKPSYCRLYTNIKIVYVQQLWMSENTHRTKVFEYHVFFYFSCFIFCVVDMFFVPKWWQ